MLVVPPGILLLQELSQLRELPLLPYPFFQPAAHVMAGAPAAELDYEDTLRIEATYCR